MLLVGAAAARALRPCPYIQPSRDACCRPSEGRGTPCCSVVPVKRRACSAERMMKLRTGINRDQPTTTHLPLLLVVVENKRDDSRGHPTP